MSYFRKIIFLSGGGIKDFLKLASIFFIVGIIDLVGLTFIGIFVKSLLQVEGHLSFLGFYIDHSVAEDLPIYLLGIFSLKLVVGVVANFYIFKEAARVEAELKTRLLGKYQSISYVNFISRDTSAYITAINNWVPQYARLVYLSLVRLLAESLVGMMTVAFLFYLNPIAFLSGVSLVGVMLLFYYYSFKNINLRCAQEFKKSSVELVSLVKQALDGLKEIRSMQGESYFYKRSVLNANKVAEAQARSNIISNSARNFLEFSLICFVAAIPLFLTDGSFLGLIPTLAIFATASLRIVSIFGLLNVTLTQLAFNKEIVNDLYNDAKQIDAVNLGQGNILYKEESCEHGWKDIEQIELTDVSFGYCSERNILDKASLSIKKGEKIAIFGGSGSGKSTLLDILLGLVRPTKGHIKYLFKGGRVSDSITPLSFTYVPQGSFVLSGTVRENLLFNTSLDVEDHLVKEAMKIAGIDFLKTSADYEQYIDSSGSQMSGGQIQRLSIARALLQHKSLLIFDEATSAVDQNTEMQIIEAVTSLGNDRTIICVTHRKELLPFFDKVFRIENRGLVKSVL